MRYLPAFSLIIILLFAASPVFAGNAEDYIKGEIDEWTQVAADNGYTVLGTYIGQVGETSETYTFDLEPGVYHFYASGGDNVEDLDTYAYDEDGIELGSDTEPDKIPIVILKLDKRITLDFEIAGFSFTGGATSDYFCLVVASEIKGGINSFEGETITDFPENGGDGEDSYRAEADSILENWLSYEEGLGNEIFDSGVIGAGYDGATLDLDLEPGLYQVYAEPDSRCSDLDITIYDASDVQLADDHLEDNLPICEFMVLSHQAVSVALEVYTLIEGAEETYIGYVVLKLGGTNREDRIRYIEDQLTTLHDNNVYEGVSVYQEDWYEISESENVFTYDVQLEPGSYFAEAQGGVAVANLDMHVYDEAGTLLNEDTLDDNFPIVSFSVPELQTVSFVIEAIDFVEGIDDDFFAFILTSSEDYYDDYVYDDVYYDDESLLSTLTTESEVWNKVISSHGEEIVDSFTESIISGENDDTWSTSYAFSEGIYYIYAQGDGLCLTDIDMYVYGDGEEALFQDALSDNSPMLRLVVGPEGAEYRIEIYGFSLVCEKGFFNLTIAKPGVVITDPQAYIENELTEWRTTAENQGYEILGEYMGTVYGGANEDGIICGEETWTMQLGPGFYTLYASGGAHIQDLDLTVNDADGKPLGSDTSGDNIPVVRIILSETTDVKVIFTACSYDPGFEDGLVCLVVATDADGEIVDFEGSVL